MKILNIILIAALYMSFSSNSAFARCKEGEEPHPQWKHACIVKRKVPSPCASYPEAYYVFKYQLCVACEDGYVYDKINKKCVKAS